MTYLGKDISPRDYIFIQKLNTITDIDKQVVLSLYQPIIGASATALYLFLVNCPQRIQHKTIFDMLHFGTQILYDARIRLEAIGLLKTYITQVEQQDKYIYEVCTPVSPKTFFSDPVYCGLLVAQVGENQFNVLKDMYMIKSVSTKDYQDISYSFHALFGKQLKVYTSDFHSVIGQEKSQLVLDDKDFDWTFFHQLLQGSYILPTQLTAQVKYAIQGLHHIYGIQPLDMRDYVLQSHDMVTNKIDVDKLYQIVRNAMQNQSKSSTQIEITPLSETAVGHTDKKSALMTLCQNTVPAEFLKHIKHAKNQQNASGLYYQVSQNELKLIERLMTQYGFHQEVVNLLVHYILVVLNHDTLSASYVDKVANDWVKQHITTVEMAMAYLQTREQKRDVPSSKSVRSKKGNVKQIKMTEEEKNALNDEDTPIDDEEWNNILSTLK
ncbi:hypothetical protein GMA11_05630 [Granulicatella sp. zg-ZJ]|uniref:DnaD domain protein n=1 Tax=unclassified Granulicatella TaxID=2630493 RepID=UPI0013C0B7DB|nr:MULTISPECIES: DnaD domain protein [unclassified Granulicatella]NEW62869.1 hypothetical protein [Granulicatella sp. zg-ZJ]NEW66314.1 hypothetical protein [Granulicatella sp. zg-84]QMI85380.1 DnaD domain protein [Carnobacteriaceae bacterium zg-84]